MIFKKFLGSFCKKHKKIFGIKSTLNKAKMNSIIKEFCQEYNCQEYNCEETWDSFFYKKHDVIFRNMDLLIEECEKFGNCENCENNKETFYKYESFQDYVDRHIDFNKIGAYNYQAFCKSMNDLKFRNEIYDKYEKDEKIKKIKNHLIFFIKKWNEKELKNSKNSKNSKNRQLSIPSCIE